MKDYRCKNCHKLLFKEVTDTSFIPGKNIIEAKCPKCKIMNRVVINHYLNINDVVLSKV